MKKIHYFWIVLIFLLPTIVGYMSHDDLYYTGLNYATDGNNYLSIMNQAKEGHLLFTNMYTHEDVPYLNIRPTFMVAGWISKVTFLPNIMIYHLFRILGIVLFIYYLEKILKLIFKNEKYKFWTILLTIFTSGIGWFFILINKFGIKQYGSIDQWVTDANNFLLFLAHPHSIFSIVLMLAGSYYFILWYKDYQFKDLLISGLLFFILGFEHLFDVITLGLVIGFFLIDMIIIKKFNWKKWKHLIPYLIIISIPFIYTYIMFTNPTYAAWNDQNTLETPKFLHVIFGYGFMMFAFIAFLIISLNNYSKVKPEIKYMLYWIISTLILIYSPFNIQRRFFEGAHIPFGIVTGVFLFMIVKKYLNTKYFKIALIVLFIFMIPTNLIHLYRHSTPDGLNWSYPYKTSSYLTKPEIDAINWLELNTEPVSVIISNYNIGNHIPAYVNRRVYLGHWAQTIDYEIKNEIYNRFYEYQDINFDFNKTQYLFIDKMIHNNKLVYGKDMIYIYKLN